MLTLKLAEDPAKRPVTVAAGPHLPE